MQILLPVLKQMPKQMLKQKTQQILHPQVQVFPSGQKMLRPVTQVFTVKRQVLHLLRKGASICPKQLRQSLKKTA